MVLISGDFRNVREIGPLEHPLRAGASSGTFPKGRVRDPSATPSTGRARDSATMKAESEEPGGREPQKRNPRGFPLPFSLLPVLSIPPRAAPRTLGAADGGRSATP